MICSRVEKFVDQHLSTGGALDALRTSTRHRCGIDVGVVVVNLSQAVMVVMTSESTMLPSQVGSKAAVKYAVFASEAK